MQNIHLFWFIIKKCRFDKFVIGFVVSFLLVALFIQMSEPGINSYGDALWYTFVSCTSIGFGDFTSVTIPGRILTVFISCYEILLVALLSGVIVSHYLEVIHRREEYSATVFLDKLTHLTGLTPEELRGIEEKAKRFERDNRMQ